MKVRRIVVQDKNGSWGQPEIYSSKFSKFGDSFVGIILQP